jgi:hypothetical protein
MTVAASSKGRLVMAWVSQATNRFRQLLISAIMPAASRLRVRSCVAKLLHEAQLRMGQLRTVGDHQIAFKFATREDAALPAPARWPQLRLLALKALAPVGPTRFPHRSFYRPLNVRRKAQVEQMIQLLPPGSR